MTRLAPDRWGPNGPPLDAYSRVTDAERFRPLHDEALRLLERMQSLFNVGRTERLGVDPELEARQQLSRATIRLVPAEPASAPIVVAFTSFPGLVVRCGRWFIDRFPVCGCDACSETAESEAERLRQLFADVTEGRFRESISLPLIGTAWYEYELGAPWHGRGRSRLTRSRARQHVGDGARSFHWAPWT